MEQYYKIVFEALEKSSGIEKAVSEISAGLQVPVAVLDPYGRLLADAYTSFFPAPDTDGGQKEILWIHMIEDYYTRVYDRECESSSVVEESEEGITVLNAVLFKGSLQGFCITFHFGKETCPLNRLICRALAVGYGRRDFVSNLKGFGLKQLISRVLLGRGREQERFPEIGEEIYEACAPAPFMMAVIEPDKKSDLNIWRIYQEISSHFPELLFYRDAGEIAVLFVSVDSEKKSNSILSCLDCLLERESGVCGISGVFDRRDQTDARKKMLKRLIRIGRHIDPEKRIYTEYQYYMELVCSYAQEEIGISGCFGRELERLEREDKEKGTEFYNSLKEYLLMGNNVNLAAKRLFIHRNTMVYRLAKIHEILKLDVNDPEVAKRLMISMILRTLEPVCLSEPECTKRGQIDSLFL